MNFISLEEFKKTEDYNNFIKENPTTGKLKVEVFTAYQAIPIPDTEIIITKDIGNLTFIYTSSKLSGIIFTYWIIPKFPNMAISYFFILSKPSWIAVKSYSVNAAVSPGL